MFLRKQQTRFVSRLVAGLFAVQIVVTGFCLLTTQAHAMPMAHMDGHSMSASHMTDSMTAEMAEHCSKPMQGSGHDADSSQSDGCFHCDEPAQFVKAGNVDMTPVSLVLVALSVLPEMPVLAAGSETTSFHTPPGPPDSSSILYTTTQRIRV
ncbi:MAG: hypothetical protein Q9M23_03570 [Mariprofundaceae bacterium]|nr:hypothetical protein [Mariprofundaceae bacterium]